MALAELLRSLEQEADAQVRSVLDQARAAADGIRAQRAGELARRRAAAGDARARELDTAAAREIEAARREAARLVLEARAEALGRVRQRAERRLAERAADPTGVPVLTRDLALALTYAGPVSVVIEAPPPLLAPLREAATDPARMRFVPATDSRHGLVVRTDDGRLTVDASSEYRLARAWPGLAIEVARRLESLP